MYCPRCGDNIPDDSIYCGNCGHQLGASRANVVDMTSSKPLLRKLSFQGASKVGLVSNATEQLVLLFAPILMAVFLFLPWLKIPLLENITPNSASSLLGISGLSLKSSYSLWEIGDAFDAIAALFSASSDSASYVSYASFMSFYFKGTFLLSVILIVVGIAFAFSDRGTKVLRVVMLIMFAHAGSWITGIIYSNYFFKELLLQQIVKSQTLSVFPVVASGVNLLTVPIWPWLFLVLSIVTVVLAERIVRSRDIEPGIAPLALGGLLASFSGIGITSVICGVLSLRRVHANSIPSKRNTGISIAAIVLGILALLGNLLSVIQLQSNLLL